MCKFVIVVGGVYSGTGKGIVASSLGLLMKLRGKKIQIIKFDPYLNINAGIIRPSDHGEVYVCDDGSEVDLDLGSYFRIAGIETSNKNICTSGTLYKEILDEQEQGKHIGNTVQLQPHMTNKVKKRLNDLKEDNDLVVVEIGGTVGDSESYMFFEAIRQFKQELKDDVLITMVSPVLWVNTIKEFKTKPLQNSVIELQKHGLQPDIMFCRSEKEIPNDILQKVSMITGIKRDNIFDAPDVKTVYQVPVEFYNRHVDDSIVDLFRMKRGSCRIQKYRKLVDKCKSDDLPILNIAIIGKYSNCDESYISVKESLVHAAAFNEVRVNIKWVNSNDLNENYLKSMMLHGLIVPGGFDSRGTEGKIEAIKFCRENKIPFLGICLGLQCAVIEFCRNVLNIKNATSEEFDKNSDNKVVHLMESQKKLKTKLSNMRLGAFDCVLEKQSLAYKLYKKVNISERHRHRFEINNEYESLMREKGFFVSGKSPDNELIEIMELDTELHPFFIATQAHPEFKSSLVDPSCLFSGLVKSSLDYKTRSEAKA